MIKKCGNCTQMYQHIIHLSTTKDQKQRSTTNVITFSLVIFSFISGNIPAARAYGGNISQLVSHIEKLYCFHHELLNRFKISISQMTMTLFYFIFSCLYHQTLTDLTNVASMWLIYLVFRVVFFCFAFPRSVSCAQCR